MGDGDHTADIITPKMTEDFSEVRDSLEAIGFSRQVHTHTHTHTHRGMSLKDW